MPVADRPCITPRVSDARTDHREERTMAKKHDHEIVNATVRDGRCNEPFMSLPTVRCDLEPHSKRRSHVMHFPDGCKRVAWQHGFGTG